MTDKQLERQRVQELFVVFRDNCSTELLRQTVRYNPEPESVKAAKQVIAYRKRNNLN